MNLTETEIASPEALRRAWDSRELVRGEASLVALALMDGHLVEDVLSALPAELAADVVDFGMREALAVDRTRTGRGIEIPRSARARERFRAWLEAKQPRYAEMERWRRVWIELATLDVRCAGWSPPGLDAWADDAWLFGAASLEARRAFRVLRGSGAPQVVARDAGWLVVDDVPGVARRLQELVLHVGARPEVPFAHRALLDAWLRNGEVIIEQPIPFASILPLAA